MEYFDGYDNDFNDPFGFGVPTFGTMETMLPSYCAPVSRKRQRANRENLIVVNPCGSDTFLSEDFTSQMQWIEMEIDCYFSQSTEKMILYINEMRNQHLMRIVGTMEEHLRKKLRAHEEQIDNIGQFNFALVERANFLLEENQMWRNLAQTSEATANALRSKLEQLLAQDSITGAGDPPPLIDDAESCCGSNYGDDCDVNSWRMLADEDANRWCRKCKKEEPSVLLLPCRHLCLCSSCGPWIDACPVCKSNKNASVNINMSCC